ncbi:MAG: 50S ribosomal protein L22 [Candidatus Tyloplasma litorale]|nr:MAG: 50S ribosomal protein L22 [Mycoplasmatales bacterium]
MEAKATSKIVRVSSQKAGLVCELIRNKSIEESFAILENSTLKSATLLRKVLNSAVANATENHGMTSDGLYVKAAFANEGPTMKRFRARAKGRADQKLRRTAHLTVIVTDEKRGK